MDLYELQTWIAMQNGRLKRYHGDKLDHNGFLLQQTVKLGEEVGELCSEVLTYQSLQSKQKLETHDKENLAAEVADVLITTMLIAESHQVNFSDALTRKIEKINKRFENV